MQIHSFSAKNKQHKLLISFAIEITFEINSKLSSRMILSWCALCHITRQASQWIARQCLIPNRSSRASNPYSEIKASVSYLKTEDRTSHFYISKYNISKNGYYIQFVASFADTRKADISLIW